METIITVILVHNILLFQFLGTDLIIDKRLKDTSSLSVLLVSLSATIIVSILNYAVYENLIKENNLQYLMVFLFSINILISALLVDFLFKKIFTFLHQNLKDLIYVVSFSTLIFGVCLMNIQKVKVFSSYLYMNILNVLGFLLIYYLMRSIGKKIIYNKFPKYIFPLPIIFVLLGILSMAFKGLANAFY